MIVPAHLVCCDLACLRRFHDDQHGTAVVAGAGLLNALELIGERMLAVSDAACCIDTQRGR